MEHPSRALAFDFGASSGRAILGTFDGETIRIEEVHRFSNDPMAIRGTLYWDVLRQYYEIKQGLLKAKQHGGCDTVAVDTWGGDFGLLDEGGYLLDNPVHYRDQRTKGLVEESFKSIPQEEFYQLTGIQLMELNTVFQLMALSSGQKRCCSCRIYSTIYSQAKSKRSSPLPPLHSCWTHRRAVGRKRCCFALESPKIF